MPMQNHQKLNHTSVNITTTAPVAENPETLKLLSLWALRDVNNLSPRQRAVFWIIARGYTVKEAADQLHITTATATTHASRLRPVLRDHLRSQDHASLVHFANRLWAFVQAFGLGNQLKT